MRRKLEAMAILLVGLFLLVGLTTASAVELDGGSSAELSPYALADDARQLALAGAAWQHPDDLAQVAAAGITETARLARTFDPRIQAMINQVDGETLSHYVGDLSGEWPVIVDGDWVTLTTRYTLSGEPIQKAVQFVADRLEATGLDVEYHAWAQDRPPNVVAELRGETHPDEVYILCAHLDSITRQSPMVLAPGADDNASGVAAVLHAAEILSRYRWGCTLRFALWTGEEQGLWGSYYYAQRAYTAGETIAGVLNLDMIAWDGIDGPDLDLHARQTLVPSSMDLAELFSDVVGIYDLNLIPQIVSNGSGASDQASFWNWGYPAILAIEDYEPGGHDFNPYYHSDQDLLQQLDLEYFAEFARAAVGTFAHMGCLLPEGPNQWHFYLPLIVQAG
jgi:hypothetical protein